MKKRVFFLFTVFLALMGMVPVAAQAATQNDTNGAASETGGGTALQPLTYTAAEKEVLRQRLSGEVAAGRVGASEVRAQLASAGLAASAVDAALANAGSSKAALATTPSEAAKSVSVPHKAQTKTYYCGPASGLMILNGAGVTKSKKTGATLTQAVLANSSHMNTEGYGSTPWSPAQFARGLNNASGWTGGKIFIHQRPASLALFKAIASWRVEITNTAGGINMQETYASGTYNGHPAVALGKQRGHWLANYGYTTDVASVKIDDPASGATVLGWNQSMIKDKFSIASSKVYPNFLPAPYGLAY